jgi:4-diphosphocytidyl-2-C-methyl-D-erythritol kinase
VKPSTSISLRTNAKLNLFLRVIGLRLDGYHELESVFHGVAFADDISIEPSEQDDVEVLFEAGAGFGSELPADENTLVAAAAALREQGVDVPGSRVHVRKRIPAGSGLGGGSGNAAGFLLGLNELFGLGLGKQELLAAAALVGSDVPYCITGGTKLAMSRGEDLHSLPATMSMTFILGMSNQPLHTGEVYATFDNLDKIAAPSSAPLVHALGAGDVEDVASLLHNDLERAAFVLRPELEDAKRTMRKAGALGSGISGSGPTVFGIARDRESAEAIAGVVEGTFDRVEIAESAEKGVEIVRRGV